MFRWEVSSQQAWLSLFRFIDFWMGLPYLEVNSIFPTLDKPYQSIALETPAGQSATNGTE